MKNRYFKYIFLILASLASLIISVIKYVSSYEIYKDEYGTDISFNNDYVVAIVISFVLVVYAIYAFLSVKNNVTYENAYIYSGLCICSLLTFYPLGVFFKAINKHKELSTYYSYLYIGIVCLFMLMYFVFALLNNIKTKNN